MPPNAKFGLHYDRPEKTAVRIAERSETDAEFYQRKQEAQKKNEAIRCLNAKSKEVDEAIHERLWATMYLEYLVERVHISDRALIEFSDLPGLPKFRLSDSDPRTASPPIYFDGQPYELQMQMLELRLEDARRGLEAMWSTLDALIHQLTSGIVNWLSFPRSI